MTKYTITLSDDHVKAILDRIATLPQMFDQATQKMKQQYADDGEYVAGIIKNDLNVIVSFVPSVATAEQAMQAAQAERQATLTTLQDAVTVTKE